MPAGSVLPVLNTVLGAVSPATGDKSVIGVRAHRFRAGPDSASAPSSAKLRRGEGSGRAFWRRAGGGCLSALGLGRGPRRRRVQAGTGRERVPGRAGCQLAWQGSRRAFASGGHHPVAGGG